MDRPRRESICTDKEKQQIKMGHIEEEELKAEIKHIFDSGANEIRVLEMVKSKLKDNVNIEGINGCFSLKIEDCWTACTKIKADKGHLFNKSTEWNNAYQEGFDECFKWLQKYSNTPINPLNNGTKNRNRNTRIPPRVEAWWAFRQAMQSVYINRSH